MKESLKVFGTGVALLAGIGLVIYLKASSHSTPAARPSEKPPIKFPQPINTPQPKFPKEPTLVIDSQMPMANALGQNAFPKSVTEHMQVVTVTYLGFDNVLHQGEIVVNGDLANEVKGIFKELLDAKWPIQKVIPIYRYEWDDDRSVADNNTSSFNYRRVAGGSSLSMHAYGRAIDLNPFQNPYVQADGSAPTEYKPGAKGTITRESAPYKAFRKRGWIWGGDWAGTKDYQHFEKHPRKF